MKSRKVELEDMLNQREHRVTLINKAHQEFPNKTVISYKLNIPGDVKNNDLYAWAFQEGLKQFKLDLVYSDLYLDNITGPEAILVVNESNVDVKRALIDIEKKNDLGRLYDFDVSGVSRSDLNLPPRKCLICSDDAHACSRSRKHSLETVLEKIEKIILNEYNGNNS